MQGFGLARLGRDAELRSTPNGTQVCNLALAFTRRAQNGEKATDWVEGVLWGKRAEALAPHLLKGGMVSVTLNNVRIETYQSAKGAGHKLIGEIIEIELAGGGQQAAPAPKPAARPAAKPTPRREPGAEFDDDIPFLFNMNTICDTMGSSKQFMRAKNGKGLSILWANKTDF